ncbi:MAG: toprim domain-containing protein [Pirellulales bacterium]
MYWARFPGPSHPKTLRQCESVVLLLDGDEAGQKRSDEVLELFLHAQMDVRIVTLPDDLDPADFLLERGLDQFNQAIEWPVMHWSFVCEGRSAGFDPLLDTLSGSEPGWIFIVARKSPAAGLTATKRFAFAKIKLAPRFGSAVCNS